MAIYIQYAKLAPLMSERTRFFLRSLEKHRAKHPFKGETP